MNRKERRIQEALGLKDDIPPTMWWTATYYVWLGQMHVHRFFDESIWRWVAFKLPKTLIYHAVIRLWAHATTCPSGRNDCPDAVDIWTALKRWEKE